MSNLSGMLIFVFSSPRVSPLLLSFSLCLCVHNFIPSKGGSIIIMWPWSKLNGASSQIKITLFALHVAWAKLKFGSVRRFPLPLHSSMDATSKESQKRGIVFCFNFPHIRIPFDHLYLGPHGSASHFRCLLWSLFFPLTKLHFTPKIKVNSSVGKCTWNVNQSTDPGPEGSLVNFRFGLFLFFHILNFSLFIFSLLVSFRVSQVPLCQCEM